MMVRVLRLINSTLSNNIYNTECVGFRIFEKRMKKSGDHMVNLELCDLLYGRLTAIFKIENGARLAIIRVWPATWA